MKRLALLLFLALLMPVSGQAADRSVLLLHSYHPDFPWTRAVDHGIRKVMSQLPDPPVIYTEYLDSKRFPPRQQFPRMATLLKGKYTGITPGIILTSDDNALAFALEYRRELFPGVPIVFCGVNNLERHRLNRHDKVTGVPERFDILGTLRLARRLFPNYSTIAFVSDSTTTGRLNLREAMKLRDALGRDINYRFLIELTQSELAEALRELPDSSLVVNLGFWRDRHGNLLSNQESMRFLASNSPGPVLTLWDFLIGEGTLGGLVVNGERQGETAALLAAEILRGADPGHLPVLSQSPNTPMFDWQVMRRFGLKADQLPQETVLLNQPDDWMARNRGKVWAVVLLILAETGLLGLLLFNIVRRRHSEARLQQRDADFRKLIEASPIPMRVTRLGGEVIYVNRQFTELLGYRREDIPTMEDWFEAAYPDPNYRAQVARFWHDQVEKNTRFGQPIELREWKVRCKNGREREIVFGHTQLTELGVTTLFDVTSRNRAVRERQAFEQKVQQAQKLESLGLLAGGIAHDFNNLLMGVLGCADVVKNRLPGDSPLAQPVELIISSAERAADLTAQMLAYSGRGKFVIEPVDLNQIVSEMGQLLRTVISKDAELAVELSEAPVSVKADTTQLRQVIMNLITNASDALEGQSGHIRVRTERIEADPALLAMGVIEEDLAPGPYALIEVSDTGIGMDAETRSRIFDPFFTSKFAGRGLGLAAVLGIIRGHRGTILIDSEPGKGSRFRILLPLCDEDLTVASDSASRTDTDLASRAGTVLIIDDDATVTRTSRMLLEAHGFDVLTASDGKAGLELARGNLDRIGLVLLDLTMPGMKGEEVFTRLRQMAPRLKVVLSSGYTEQEAIDHMGAQAPDAFLHKPYDGERLLQAITRAVGAERDVLPA
ncbi:MAG: response regulator [Deltaproteobacteria bacterium]|nr:MAG: response regulator [Deltaproteobacteria bacterium]